MGCLEINESVHVRKSFVVVAVVLCEWAINAHLHKSFQVIPNVAEYIENCVYDECGEDFAEDALCDHLSEFAADCSTATLGLTIPEWRTDDLCRKLIRFWQGRKMSDLNYRVHLVF